MGGGKGGGSKGGGSKKKKTYTKAQQMAKKRIADKKKAESTGTTSKKTKVTGISKLQQLGRAPTNPRDSVAATRFREREAQGLSGLTGGPKNETPSQYRARQRKQVADAARKRNDAFRGTTAQVSRDNAMYGNTVPSGSFNISAEGKAQAEENKAIKAAKESTFDPNRALNYAKGLNLFNTANIMAPGGDMMSWYNTGAAPGKSFKQVLGDEISMSQRTKGVGKGSWNPLRGMPGYGSVRNILTGKPFNTKFEGGFETGPTEANRRVFNNLSKAYVAGQLFKQGQTGSITDQIANETIGRINPYAGTAGTDKFSTEAAAARERGPLLSIGNFKVPEFGLSEYMGINTADRAPKNVQVASTDAGGLNIGTKEATTKGDPTGRSIFSVGKGIADFAFNDKTDFDNLGSGLFGKGIVTPQDVKSDIKTSINKIGPMNTLALGIENFRDYNRIKDADNKALAFAQNVNADQFAKTLRFAEDSKAVQKAGENLEALTGQKNVNLPSDFKAQIKNVVKGIQEETGGIEQGKVNNRFMMKNRVDEINNLLANVNQNQNLSTLSKIGGQFDPSTNPNAANMTNLQKIAAGFNPKSPNVKALSFSDRGIVGSGGNLLIGGKLSDIYRQATGNIEGGVNAGIPTGQVGLSNADMFNVATSAIKNINTPGTLSAKQADSIQRTIKGGVTAGSLIKGVLPKFQRSTGGGNTTRPTTGGGVTQQQLIEELLINQTPTTTTTTPTQTVGDAGNLADLQRQAYLRQLASYGFNPNYFAQVRPRFNTKPKSFSDYFRR